MKSNRIKNKIALLLGGNSPEREVSLSSGLAIYKALENLNYNVKIIDPAYGENQPEDQEKFFQTKPFTEISTSNYIRAFNSTHFENIDIVFIALHGKWGEDGTVQSLLELKKISYTGSGVLASAVSMDKALSKVIFQHHNVNTPDWIIIDGNKSNTDIKAHVKKSIGYPCIIKPNDQGSTIGLSLCESEDQLESGIAEAGKFSNNVLLEKFIEGRELTVGILDDQPLPPLEIIPKHSLYDYECKYTDGMSSYEVPARLPEEIKILLQQQALLAYKALGCRSYGRVDFRLSKENVPYCLELNTLPGMTGNSLVPKMALAAGISFENLIEKITINSRR